jgi:hypothetical protein
MDGLKYLLCIVCMYALVSVSGCIVIRDRGPHAVEIEEIEIDYEPPAPPTTIVVTRPPRPSRVHVWIEGHYVVRSGKWVWVKGNWARPTHKGAQWVPGHTRRRGKAWVWTPGRWR